MKERDETKKIAIFHEITLKGFQKAAQSLETILGDLITIQNKELGEIQLPIEDELINLMEDEHFFVLKTRIVGEINGESFLILTYKDAAIIWEAKLNEEQKQDESLKIALLLEIDNILTASWITVLSDYYQIQAYGEVPTYVNLSTEELKIYLEEQLQMLEIKFAYQTAFKSQHYNIQPEFIFGFQNLHTNIQDEQTSNNQFL